MSNAVMTSTQVKVTLSIQIDSDREAELINLLTLLIQVLLSIGRVGHKVGRCIREIAIVVSDIQEALVFHLTVLRVGFNSLAFGVGVRL